MNQPAKLTARAIPHDFEAEKWVLGSIMLDPSHFAQVASTLTADDFLAPDHAKIFNGMLALRTISRPPTAELICEYMRPFDSGIILAIAMSVPHAGHVKHYTDIVAKHGLSRRVIGSCASLLSDAYDSDDPEQLVRRMQNDAVALARTGRQYTAPVRLSDAAHIVTCSLENAEAIDNVNRAAWGLYSVDERLGPLMPGEVAVVAARPGMGKTAFGFQMLRHSAEQDRPALFVSLEMEASELATRDLARLADIDSRRIRRGEINDEDIRAIRNAQTDIGDLPLYIWAPSVATLAEIRGVLMNAIDKHGVRLACIDYLSLVEVENHQRKEMRHMQVAALSRGLKRLAKELKIQLVVLQQLNRDADNQEPRLSSLRESGAVEQDADVVMFIHHGMDGKTQMAPDQRMLLVPKFRAGPIGKILVKWDGRKTQFRDQQAVDRGNYERIFDDFNAKAENF